MVENQRGYYKQGITTVVVIIITVLCLLKGNDKMTFVVFVFALVSLTSNGRLRPPCLNLHTFALQKPVHKSA